MPKLIFRRALTNPRVCQPFGGQCLGGSMRLRFFPLGERSFAVWCCHTRILYVSAIAPQPVNCAPNLTSDNTEYGGTFAANGRFWAGASAALVGFVPQTNVLGMSTLAKLVVTKSHFKALSAL